jgi:hypothetical protein
MNGTAHEKVNAGHLKRNAYLYIRQSTLRQVLENTESTIRQYDLRQRAVGECPLVGRPSDSLSDNSSFHVGIGPAERASMLGIGSDVSH